MQDNQPVDSFTVPARTFQAALNILASLPYMQVAEVMAALQQSEPHFQNEPQLPPGIS